MPRIEPQPRVLSVTVDHKGHRTVVREPPRPPHVVRPPDLSGLSPAQLRRRAKLHGQQRDLRLAALARAEQQAESARQRRQDAAVARLEELTLEAAEVLEELRAEG